MFFRDENEVTDKFESGKFNERLTDMVKDFNRSNPDAFGTDTHALSELEKLCKEYIISKGDLNNIFQAGSELKNKFLKEYKDELQRYRYLPRIEELCKEIKDTLNRLKKSDEAILERFEEIIKEYRKDYHFSEDEINPGIKQEREALTRLLQH